MDTKQITLKTEIDKKLESAETLRTQALNSVVEKARKVEEKREKALKTLEEKENSKKTAINSKLESAETLRS